jgi:hypothetical protein
MAPLAKQVSDKSRETLITAAANYRRLRYIAEWEGSGINAESDLSHDVSIQPGWLVKSPCP